MPPKQAKQAKQAKPKAKKKAKQPFPVFEDDTPWLNMNKPAKPYQTYRVAGTFTHPPDVEPGQRPAVFGDNKMWSFDRQSTLTEAERKVNYAEWRDFLEEKERQKRLREEKGARARERFEAMKQQMFGTSSSASSSSSSAAAAAAAYPTAGSSSSSSSASASFPHAHRPMFPVGQSEGEMLQSADFKPRKSQPARAAKTKVHLEREAKLDREYAAAQARAAGASSSSASSSSSAAQLAPAAAAPAAAPRAPVGVPARAPPRVYISDDSDAVEVKLSKGRGYGLFAKKTLAPNTRFVYGGIWVQQEEKEWLMANDLDDYLAESGNADWWINADPEDETFYDRWALYINEPTYGKETENTVFGKERDPHGEVTYRTAFITAREIAVGEEILGLYGAGYNRKGRYRPGAAIVRPAWLQKKTR